MKRYINPEDDRYVYHIQHTLNGYSIEVLIVSTGDIAALIPQVAAQLQVSLTDTFRLQSCTLDAAEQQLDELAKQNGWVELKANG
ncbi:MAG: hypothetical protein K6A94_00775 [Bacteroidales bacterium]|nr:hypothetical protein [Bacteroidales bacterium]